MVRRTALLVAALAAAATVLVTAPANAAAYGVTLAVSKTDADVGTSVTLSGKVTGKSSAGRTVYLQRQSGSTWTTVTTTKTTSASTYSKAVKIPAAGTNSYRAVVKATSSTGRGQSTTRTVTGWTWLNLAQQPHASAGVVLVGNTLQIAGAVRKHNIEMTPNYSTVNWNLGGFCDKSDITTALYDGFDAEAGTSVLVSASGSSTVVTARSGKLTRADVVTEDEQTLFIRRSDDNKLAAVLTTPRVHCSVSRLPNVAAILD